MELKKRLSQDLKDYQSIPFWSWNDELEADELRRQIREMKKAGIGGFFMHARGGLTTEYLGEKWFDVTGACIDEARKQGMDAWCYDENGWPSGFAGMKLLEDENNWEHYIVCETKKEFDESALAVYALNGQRIERVRAALDGEHDYITIYERKNSSVVDILNPEIVRKFLDETHEKYYARFGRDFGNPMMGFFTDEPQFFRWDTAYTPVMLEEYRRRYGEDLLDELGALFVDCEQSDRLRFRYWTVMNFLYTENFAKQIYDWCTEHNCQLTGHTIEESSLFGQMMCCAGVMPFYKYEHKPGMDWLGRDISTEASPRQVSSVAQQYGKKHVLTETFACAGWDVTPRELKRIAEWQYVNGVNQMCQHLYPYSIRGQRKRDYPAFYSEHNTWTQPEEFRHFNDYFTALGYMLAESTEVADVAVIHPIHSAYLTFKRNERDCVTELNRRFFELIETLGRANIGHHYIDETLLKEDGRVDGDRLVMGKCAYSIVVVPEMDNLDANTAALLKQFVANGGKLYLQGEAPTLVDGEKADLSFLRANIAFDDMVSDEYSINAPSTEIRSTMRHADFGRFLYAVNLSSEATFAVEYRFAAKGAKRFDLETREEAPLSFRREGDEIVVPLTFAPGQSYVILLDDEAQSVAPAETGAVHSVTDGEAEIVAADENTLTLDYASMSFDGVEYTRPLPIMAVSDRLLRGKTNRTVFVKYAFEMAERPASLRVEFEDMNARSVRLNGEELGKTETGSFDLSFRTADILDKAVVGHNELVFEIDYTQPQEVYDVFNGVYYEHSDGTESLINCLSYRTNIECVYLRGDFGVKAGAFREGEKHTLITSDGFAIVPSKKKVHIGALAQEGYPFFGGRMTFRFHVTADGTETMLRLPGRYAIAKVRVNGGAEKMVMFDTACDVSGLLKKGDNTVDVTLYSSYRNVFGPFHFAKDPEPFGVSPDLFSGYGWWKEDGTCEHYTDDYAFVRFGLTGLELA